jgi:CspA family cold shock protein
MQIGKVKYWNQDKGYGFLVPDDGSEDLFVHCTQVQGGGALSVGAKVSYTRGISARDGRPCAQGVAEIDPKATPITGNDSRW